MLRKTRELKTHNPKKETNQCAMSIRTKATMTTTASNNDHNFTNNSNAD